MRKYFKFKYTLTFIFLWILSIVIPRIVYLADTEPFDQVLWDIWKQAHLLSGHIINYNSSIQCLNITRIIGEMLSITLILYIIAVVVIQYREQQ